MWMERMIGQTGKFGRKVDKGRKMNDSMEFQTLGLVNIHNSNLLIKQPLHNHPAPDGDYLFVMGYDQVYSPRGDMFERQF